jgi:glycosyltransferase involved in cell wall biosynthesis
MKINAVATFPKIKDGIPRVAEELLKGLSTKEHVNSIWLITWPDLNFVSPSLLANKKMHLFAARKYPSLRTLVKLIKLYKQGDSLLFLAPPWRVFDPSQALWLFLLIKYGFLPQSNWIQVLYDFIPYVCPEDDGGEKRAKRLFNAFKRLFVDVPAAYVAVSEATKRDAMRFWGLSANSVTVIHQGSFIAPKVPRIRFGSKKILIVSDISPRKNHLRLIKAFELVHRDNPGNDAELVIAGSLRRDIPEFESTLQDIRRRNEAIKITLRGYLTDSEILSLYNEADIFVYPSLYEGFGLPVLEAMACGCPVIASNVSALPEVVGEAGLLVDPYDVEALAHAMSTVLQDDELKMEMSRKSIAQAQKFSWEKASAEMLAVCEEVAERARAPID